MRKILFINVLLFLLLTAADIYSCSCAGWHSFLHGYKNGDLICILKVDSYNTFTVGEPQLSMEASIINLVNGTEERKTITVWGDRGWDCAPYIVQFPIGTEWFVSLSQINDTIFYYSPGLELGDYIVEGCYQSYLAVNDSMVTGYIFEEDIVEYIPQHSITIDSLIAIVNGITDIDNTPNSLPERFELSQNYPNPFNPTTTISYSIPKVGSDLSLRKVQLKIYDILGNELSTLVNKVQSAGTYQVQFDATNLPSGVYCYTVTSGKFRKTKKMILLK